MSKKRVIQCLVMACIGLGTQASFFPALPPFEVELELPSLEDFEKVRVDARYQDYKHRTWLHYIATFCNASHLTKIQYLLAVYPDALKKEDYLLLTPVHRAAHYGRIDMMKIFIDHEIDVNCSNTEGNTPLHATLLDKGMENKKCSIEMIRLLLKHGADPLQKNLWGQSPLGLAKEFGNTFAVQEMEEALRRLAD